MLLMTWDVLAFGALEAVVALLVTVGSALLLRRSRLAIVAVLGGVVWTLSASALTLFWVAGTGSERLTTLFWDHGYQLDRVRLVALLVTVVSLLAIALRSPRR
ncbi:hypothetical protein [Nocardioides bruguierae]|uniref:Uncharacterized protein n=1 Tax=Nocardioides bruguierae TaxID=2945102 RepID=A0A9X2D453_9ACTN|nr:hypothetical protein [Nocardioides bruguierae]MCM0619032.1 hypothetical protein [Nocardioides bruguierae]